MARQAPFQAKPARLARLSEQAQPWTKWDPKSQGTTRGAVRELAEKETRART